jgi:UDP:flavonoid glycosyltransferase YjiC (YdhE family)
MDEVVKIKREKNLPVVYLSMGSTGKLYPKILSDLITYSKNRELLVVGNTCLHPVNKECKKNNNVFLTDFAPADYILPVSDVVITHGGKGTIYHALKKGVPLIGIPHQLEQEWNIKRLEQLNLGKFVSKKHYTYELLADAIEEVLEKIDFYKTNCKKYANIINNFKSEEIILSEVKEILSK